MTQPPMGPPGMMVGLCSLARRLRLRRWPARQLLILGARPDLEPAQVIEALSETAIDITTGSCNPRFNNPAVLGHDAATGYGLVNAAAAVKYAMEEF